jgi:peptidoglycan/xylan/chitin deacetylase (PgdA/CDA1 family)
MPVVLTFDDGKRTHLTEVAPLLARRGAHATFFVTSEPSRTGTIHWFDLAKRIERTAGIPRRELRRSLKQADSAHRDEVLANLAREHGVDTAPQDDDERPLTPAEVGSLARMGFTIGSHSATHPILTEEGEERIWREVDGSRRTISGWIGAPVRHFAYPNGNASKATEVHTRRAGYETAWTTVQLWVAARQDDHRLPRLQIFPWYDRGQIALKAGLALLSLLPSADGTGYAYRSERRDDARA